MPQQTESELAVDPMERLYAERLHRYTTAMRNRQPDRVPIRPFVAEFTGVYAGMTCQELVHDYEKAFEAARKCAADFDWDAVVANMVYVWTGLTQAVDLKYYGIPGIDAPADMGFQYLEPPEDQAFMRADEYDQLIEDPTVFLFNVWLPRASASVVPPGEPASYENNLSFVKGSMAMLQYFYAFGDQNARLRSESGTVSAIAGILKAPMDILADKLRGYIGLLEDLRTQPEKVKAACEALAPHLLHVAKCTADPQKQVPVSIWMHRGCVPFVAPKDFDDIYWPTLKPIIQELWADGLQTLFYAEGDWNHHLKAFAELPAGSIIYHLDQGDLFEAHEVLGDQFCLSGGIPNTLLAFGTPDEVRQRTKEVIDRVAQDGGYILDASAIVQNDATVENMRAMTDFACEYGVYSRYQTEPPANEEQPTATSSPGSFMTADDHQTPGVCVPWETKRRQLPQTTGDEALLRRIWENIDGLANTYIWQLLLSF